VPRRSTHCHDNALRCFKKFVPSFEYNRDVKGKRMERWWKEPERNGKKKIKLNFMQKEVS